jgi:hypothetical protein
MIEIQKVQAKSVWPFGNERLESVWDLHSVIWNLRHPREELRSSLGWSKIEVFMVQL